MPWLDSGAALPRCRRRELCTSSSSYAGVKPANRASAASACRSASSASAMDESGLRLWVRAAARGLLSLSLPLALAHLSCGNSTTPDRRPAGPVIVTVAETLASLPRAEPRAGEAVSGANWASSAADAARSGSSRSHLRSASAPLAAARTVTSAHARTQRRAQQLAAGPPQAWRGRNSCARR